MSVVAFSMGKATRSKSSAQIVMYLKIYFLFRWHLRKQNSPDQPRTWNIRFASKKFAVQECSYVGSRLCQERVDGKLVTGEGSRIWHLRNNHEDRWKFQVFNGSQIHPVFFPWRQKWKPRSWRLRACRREPPSIFQVLTEGQALYWNSNCYNSWRWPRIARRNKRKIPWARILPLKNRARF